MSSTRFQVTIDSPEREASHSWEWKITRVGKEDVSGSAVSLPEALEQVRQQIDSMWTGLGKMSLRDSHKIGRVKHILANPNSTLEDYSDALRAIQSTDVPGTQELEQSLWKEYRKRGGKR